MSFEYFDNPRGFAFLSEDEQACHFCSTTEDCLDGGHFFGQEDIEAICFSCMKSGKLIELDISTNDINVSLISGLPFDTEKISNEIVYCTPSLPAWQELSWPVKNGKPYRFMKIASKLDYADSEEFVASLFDCEKDAQLWEMLPEHKIDNVKEGQYDVSFYLFELEGNKLTMWDAN